MKKKDQLETQPIGNPDGQFAVRGEPVHRREHLLYLVARQRAAHLVGHPVDELAVKKLIAGS